jgi:sec-independent protein translocase protein TatB
MFDLFDPSKIFLVGVVALIVIGPKDLPRVMRTVGQVVGRMRRMANEFQQQFNEAMREAELEDVKKELAAMNDAAKVEVEGVNVSFDPAKLTQHDNAVASTASEAEKTVVEEHAIETTPAAEHMATETPPVEERREADLDDVKRELAALGASGKADPDVKPAVESSGPSLQNELAESGSREARAS